MFVRSIRNSVTRGKGLVAAAVLATTLLGACMSTGSGGGTGPQPAPAPPPPPQASLACEQRTGENGGRGFWDIGLQACYSCPLGSARTVFPVNENWACSFGGMFSTAWAPAEYLGGR